MWYLPYQCHTQYTGNRNERKQLRNNIALLHYENIVGFPFLSISNQFVIRKCHHKNISRDVPWLPTNSTHFSLFLSWVVCQQKRENMIFSAAVKPQDNIFLRTKSSMSRPRVYVTPVVFNEKQTRHVYFYERNSLVCKSVLVRTATEQRYNWKWPHAALECVPLFAYRYQNKESQLLTWFGTFQII